MLKKQDHADVTRVENPFTEDMIAKAHVQDRSTHDAASEDDTSTQDYNQIHYRTDSLLVKLEFQQELQK